MKSLVLSILFVTSLIAQDLPKEAVKETPREAKLTELQSLKAENFKLKVQLSQCNVNLVDAQSKLNNFSLTDEQAKLIEEFRKTLKAGKDDVFNWGTLTFTKADEKTIK